MQRILLTAVGVLLVAASGMVHGLWTDRWADRRDLTEAAERVESLPMVLGDWQGEDVAQADDRNTGMAGVLSRRYVHRTSGRVVSVYIGCGRPGPVSVHTPEVCYAGSGYEVEAPQTFTIPSGKGMPQGEFWTSRLLKVKSDNRTQLRIFWSWHTAKEWKVADNPRQAFAGERLLYKLYLVREMASADEPIESDACVELMRQLLPTLETTCFDKR